MSSLPELVDTTSDFPPLRFDERQRPLFAVPAILSHFCPDEWDGEDVHVDAIRRAESLADSLGNTADAEHVAALAYAGELVAALAIERTWEAPEIDGLVAALAAAVDAPRAQVRLAVYREALADPRLSGLPPGLAIQTTLRLLLAFAALDAASFWVVNPARAVRCVVALGSGTRRMRNAAEEAVRHDGAQVQKGAASAAPVRRWHRVAGVVAVLPRTGQTDVFVGEAARVLGLALERESLLGRGTARERSLVAASERRLARLGYDLHDGPLQDIAAARRELFTLRDELARRLGPAPEADAVRAGIDRLEEAVSKSELRLRELSQSAESPALLARPFRALLEAEITSFVAASDVEADVDLRGELDSLTGSQRIALLRIVQEALSNAREHSGADRIRISIVRANGSVRAEIEDNGRGFELERTLVRAAKRGRMGLVGMNERALLIGGAFDVRSAPGGPTRISVTLPEWRPLEEGADQTSDELALWT
jgi:signal transduction histidine kinase